MNGKPITGPIYSIHDIIIRLVLAGILAGIIGIERELKSKDAGLRTHFLVGIGSALIMIVSQYGFTDVVIYNNIAVDPSRIAAQVVSGIGFLGAGTIIINKKVVRGLTTAAGIWVAAAIGLASGAGLYWIAIITTVAVLGGLEILQRVFKLNSHKVIELKIIFNSKPKDDLIELLGRNSLHILSFNTETERLEENNRYHINCRFRCKKNVNTLNLLNQINEIPGVSYVNIENV
ncbi:MgtC/SapB family protein [Clostridium thermobutyricum]|uniref:MgtC/SapB family protein n=1 Tax=Clostridium thermobutyricum TaxID=29372 RepID=UPI003F5232C2